MYKHRLYGLVVGSPRPLPAPAATVEVPDIIISEQTTRLAVAHPSQTNGYTYRLTDDETTHVSWSDLFDFTVNASGSHIIAHAEKSWGHEPVYTYLLSQVISVALLRRGIESFHASGVATGDRATVLIGDCGHGKSTLTVALVRAGARLMTDDLLVLEEARCGYHVLPGARRVKLHPSAARQLQVDWPGTPMEDGSGKFLFEPPAESFQETPAQLKRIVLLEPFASEVGIEKVERPEAVRQLLAATFNPLQADVQRLQRLLLQAEQLATRVPIYRLHVPRDFNRIGEAATLAVT